FRSVNVGGVESGASWEYSTDSGSTWTSGSGTSFELSAGVHSNGSVKVRQTDAAGNVSTAGSLSGSVTVDTNASAPTISLATDTGSVNNDGITSDATVNVGGVESGASWEYSTDSGSTWISGSGTSFELSAGVHSNGSVKVRQTDVAGNVSPAGSLSGPVTVDTTASAPTISLATDTGSVNNDGITNDATVNVGGVESGASWEYSTDSGSTWTSGSGTSFELSAGVHADGSVKVRQTDVAGNVSSAGSHSGPVTVDTTLPSSPTISLATDTGSVNNDGLTSDATVNVGGIESGASWEYSMDSGSHWSAGTGTSFELSAGTHANGSVQVRQADVAGNVSTAGSLSGSVTVDTTTPSPATSTLNILSGSVATIPTSKLTATDSDNTAGQIIFAVTLAPATGTLFIDGNDNGTLDTGEGLANGGTFTQANIDAGLLKYDSSGVTDPARSFSFTVTDSASTSTVHTFDIALFTSSVAAPDPVVQLPATGSVYEITGQTKDVQLDTFVNAYVSESTPASLATIDQHMNEFISDNTVGGNVGINAVRGVVLDSADLTGNALSITGGSSVEALVIDLSGIATNPNVTFNNVDFAVIIGSAVVSGGAGNNFVVGDSAAQSIVLGTGDDTLYGGAGNDTIGSLDGNDRLYGEGGNDTMFGGAGNDHLDGGAGDDTARFNGAFGNYSIRFDEVSATYTVVDTTGADGTDTVTGFEHLQFADTTKTLGDPLDSTPPQAPPSATGVGVDKIVMKFSEAVLLGSGAIEIHKAAPAGALVESFDAATSALLSISSDMLTIDPTANLENGTDYYVTFADGSIQDFALNHYDSSSAYHFSTVAAAATASGGGSTGGGAGVAIVGAAGVGLLAWLLL
ncbi:MAG: hypothetical protein HGB04_10565, partial [Chlorobiaceae bacterium]|nr:hypothetical protein [Chlorobiaceae bacterium]